METTTFVKIAKTIGVELAKSSILVLTSTLISAALRKSTTDQVYSRAVIVQ
jgi:hypothetical protein